MPHDVSMASATACDKPEAPNVGMKIAERQCLRTADVLVTHEIRNPGARILEKESILMTLPSVSKDRNPGSTLSPVNHLSI
jgi:hypothetical protein